MGSTNMTSLLSVNPSFSFLIAVGSELVWASEWRRRFVHRPWIQMVLEGSEAIVTMNPYQTPCPLCSMPKISPTYLKG